MKLLFDFFPIIAFYITYKYKMPEIIEGQPVPSAEIVTAVITATVILIAATIMQVGYTWIKHKKVEKIHIITVALAILFGGATIAFRDPDFLIWKVSIAMWLFAAVFLLSNVIWKEPLLKKMMGSQIKMELLQWNMLNMVWVVFYVLIGVINLIVAELYGIPFWVEFKMFGLLGLNILLVIITFVYIAKYGVILEHETENESTEKQQQKETEG